MKNNTTDKPKTTKKRPKTKRILSDFYGMEFFELVPMPPAIIERFSKDLIEWAKQEKEGLTITRFLKEREICPRRYRELLKKHPALARAHDMAKAYIKDNRIVGSMKKDLDGHFVKNLLAAEKDNEWRELEEWRSKLKQAEESAKGNVNVTIEKYPETKEVPEKK